MIKQLVALSLSVSFVLIGLFTFSNCFAIDEDDEDLIYDLFEDEAVPKVIKNEGKKSISKNHELINKQLDLLTKSDVPEKASNSGEYPDEDVHYKVKHVSNYKFNLLIDSIITGSSLDLPKDIELYDGTPWSTWSNEMFFMDADINEMVIRFQYGGKNLPQDMPKSFYVSVQFEQERSIGEQMASSSIVDPKSKFGKHVGVILRHSLPKNEVERGGIRIQRLEKQQRLLLKGRDNTSLAVIVPDSVQRNTQAVVLCPRDYDVWKMKGGDKTLYTTDYEMVAVESSARGEAQIGVRSGLGPGWAKIHILTSDNILPATLPIDESKLKYPTVSLVYNPTNSKTLVDTNKEIISSGILFQTVHHNTLNQKTVSTGEVKMTIKKVQLQKTISLNMSVSKEQQRHKTLIPFKVDKGSCYAIIKERTLKHKFFKELLPRNE